MLTRILAALAVTVAVATPALGGGIAIPAGTMPMWEAKRTTLYLRLYARANNFTGVARIERDGNIVVQRVYGLADADENVSNTLTTRFHLGSLSRLFASAAILLLEQDGKLMAPALDSNSDAMTQVIETAGGLPYAAFLRQRIFAPLGLTNTSVGEGASSRAAVGTEPVGLHGVRNVRGAPDAASIVTTASDLCDFARAVWSGGFLSEASLAKLRTGTNGWTRSDRSGHTAFGGYGRAPGFGASLDYFPGSKICVALLTNTNTYVAQVAAPDIATIALGSPVTRPPMGYQTPAEGSLAKFSGAYRMPANFVQPNAAVTLSDRGNYLEAAWPNGTTSVIYPASDDYFVDRNAWASVRFTRGADGTVTGLEYNLLDRFSARKVQ